MQETHMRGEVPVQIAAFVDPATKAALTARAERNFRTLSGEIRAALAEHLEAETNSDNEPQRAAER